MQGSESQPRPRLTTIVTIYMREMRDQCRDRRTLFTIAILPLMLYPLLGMLLLQVAQFTQQHKPKLCIVGHNHLPDTPPLFEGEAFVDKLAKAAGRASLAMYSWDQLALQGSVPEQAQKFIDREKYDVVLLVPPEFQFQRATSDDSLDATSLSDDASERGPSSTLRLIFDSGSEEGRVAADRLFKVFTMWRDQVVRHTLVDQGLQLSVLQPFVLQYGKSDQPAASVTSASLWSKLLPFVMLVWAMTGAFYPAIDLVAGEKERGTLETLLCSPAKRSEIVWGKLGAVTTFSVLTALLNVGSMMMTSGFVLKQVGLSGAAQAPPVVPMLWLLVALLPLSTLFSALALAVSAMARSSKEGQYYLMPLMMVTLPLVLLPLMPGTDLHVGTAIIPVTGMFLLVRTLVEGNYGLALLNFPAVAGVTMGCLWAATRWAQRQFEDEAVMFGGNDQWDIRQWVTHLWRDRQAVPSTPQAVACGVVILVGLFFGKLMVSKLPQNLHELTALLLVPQIGLILAPPLLMAIVLTTSLRQSFRILMPRWPTLPIAVLLGLTLHPSYVTLGKWITEIYPISEQAQASMQPITHLISSASWLHVVLLMALVPAICEEFAFRGYIFNGLVRGGKIRAVLVTAVMFGVSHGMLQQSIAATVMGVMLGWVALRTGSVLPGLLIHFTNNALSVSMERIADLRSPGLEFFIRQASDGGVSYQPIWTLMASGLAITCLLYFSTVRPADELEDETDESWRDRAAEQRIVDPGWTPVA